MPPKRKPKPPPPPPVEISSAPLEDEDDATVVVVATVAADDDGDVMKSHRLSTPRVSSREMTAFEDAPLAKPKPSAPPLVAPVTPTPTTPAPPSSKKPRIDTSAITGVRVIACLAVLCQHWIQWYGKKSHGEIELQGGMAVTVFFFITGYVVYIGYADKVNEPEFGYWTFIKKRYIRLVPMHWLAILAFAPIVYVNYATIRDDYYLWQNKSSEYHMWAGWILNPFFMHTWIFSSMHYWNAPMWSVSTQCGFYFLFPFLARRMLKKIDKEETHVAQVTAGPNAGRSAGVVAELDAKKIDRNYVTRARWLFFWSIVIPVCAMSFFMSETFKKEWADPDAPDTDPGALEEDFNIVRAYFNARSWPPFRLPVFMLGMLFAAKRVRAHRNGDAANPDYVGYIGQQTDSLGWKLALWCVVSSALSCAYEDQKINVRMFNEFFLTLAVAYFVYGITVAPNDSWIARVVLRNRVMTFLGGLTYAAYVMQFVVWIYVNVVTYDSFKQFYPCDKETIHAEHEAAGGVENLAANSTVPETWFDCFKQNPGAHWMDVLVIWFVFFVFVVAFVINRYFEKPACAFLAKKLL